MKFFTIPPNSQLELMHEGTMGYFCLAQHYHSNKAYRKFFKEQKKKGAWILLDNGAGDHSLITEDILFECMKDLMPNEVVPPDILFDRDKTLFSLNSFIYKMRQENLLKEIEIFAVPQGKTKEDWLNCYEEMLNNSDVTTIGLSKLGVPYAWLGEAKDDQNIMEARHECVRELIDKNLIHKPLHFLGGAYVQEFEYYKSLENELFRSTDSCFTILAAYYNMDISSPDYKRIKTPLEYFDFTLTTEQVQLAKNNISFMKKRLGES